MSPLRLSGKRCLVTGGSRGLGRALAVSFARAGARVAFTYRANDEEARRTSALCSEAGAEPLVFRGTVTDGAHARSTVQALVDAWGGLDVLVNNAAVYPVLPFALIEEEDWDRVMSINAKGAFLFSREAARPMIRQKRGSILNIGGFGEGRLVEAPVHYAASKAALRGFSDALAIELGRHGIKVNCLEPGLCDTGLSQRLPDGRVADYVAQCALGRLATAEEIAELATFMVCDENTFMTGAKLVADGGV